MSGQNRYSDINDLTGKLRGEIRALLVSCFESEDKLQAFVLEQLGRDTLNCVAWGGGYQTSAFNLINDLNAKGGIGKMLERLQEVRPDNQKVGELIAHLVAAGYLKDTQASAPAKARRSDWIEKYPVDRVGLKATDRPLVVDAVASCFGSVAEVERFIGDCFKEKFGEEVRHGINRNDSVKNVVDAVMAEFEKRSWLNAFILAVEDAYPGNPLVVYFTIHVTQAFKPAPPASVPVNPAASANPPGSATTANAASASPKKLRVVSAKAKLTAEQCRDLSKLIVSCFNHHDLEVAVHISTGERLDHIVANGPLRKVAEDVLRWCEEEGDKLPGFLNEVIARRPGRTGDIKAVLDKLANDGAIELEQ